MPASRPGCSLASVSLVDFARRSPGLSWWLAAPGLLALVAEPLLWLFTTWSDPSYASDGAVVAALTAALLLRSVTSGPAPADPAAQRRAWRLLLATGAVRLAGRLLAVNALGAAALCFDVWALARLLRVRQRPFALRPGALAAFSALALPLEHLAQRLVGHPLRLAASGLAELALRPLEPGLLREGTLLAAPGLELAVDLPCSGARGLVLFAGLALALACRRVLSPRQLAGGLAAVALGALGANALRIVALFLGTRAGLAVQEEPWHSALGCAALALGALPLLAVAAAAKPLPPGNRRCGAGASTAGGPARRLAGATVGVLGLAIAFAPHHPLDVSAAPPERRLPRHLGERVGTALAPNALEQRYYARYGGSIEKRVYRDVDEAAHTALLVRTRAPLRHLHGPDRCLIGAGHRVTRLGVRRGLLPSVLYRSVAPDGRAWRVEASFVSDAGERATSVSEVVWRWIARPQQAWTLVERISPWDTCATDALRCRDFDAALFSALDVAPAATGSHPLPRRSAS